MNSVGTKEIVLKLNASYKVKHEKFENFSDSYFADVYNQASQIVKDIIDSERDDFESQVQNGYTEPISNLVAFNGKRGSGKTSAMLSFCDFLKDFEKYRNTENVSVCKELLQMKQQVSFTVLDSIDATLTLKANELIGAILGKMLVAIKEKERKDVEVGNPKNIEIRKLKNRLGTIYSSLEQVDVKDAAPGEVLEHLSRSWNQQEAFQESVEKFNKYMVEFKEKTIQNYLVVPIDDVDMNFDIGYELLEAIRKYLTVPNVIVLLAADYCQLGRLCTKTYDRFLNKSNDHTEELALEYMEKLIPTGRRIYMPELYQEGMLRGKRILIENEKGVKLPIKKMILGQVWEYVGILLNINAEYKHWLLPHSLRKLSNYINSMRALIDYDKDNNKNVVFNKNIQWFYDDITSRYLNENDDKSNEKSWKIISIIESFNNEIPENKIKKLVSILAKEIFETIPDLNAWSSYGILMRYLYNIWKTQKDLTMVQAISFAVSLYFRTYIFAIENGAFEYKEEFLKVTKGEFWGDLDQITTDKQGKSTRQILSETSTAEKLTLKGDLSGYGLLILAMQLGLTAEGDDKVKGTLQFGNFINIIFDYKKRIQTIAELLKKQECFKTKAEEIQDACDSLIREFKQWEDETGTTCVIPFDSAEFMFNLYDKLYGTQGIFERLSELRENGSYGKKYEKAIEVIQNLLEQYDAYYEDVRKKYCEKPDEEIPVELRRCYAEVYVKCPFIRYMNEDQNKEEREKVFSNYLSFLNFQELPEKKENLPKQVDAARENNGNETSEDD